MSELKKCKVVVFGETYSLVSDEPEHRVSVAAHEVDKLMRSVAERSGISDSRRIAVLAALQLAHRVKHLESVIQEYEVREVHLSEAIDRELFPS